MSEMHKTVEEWARCKPSAVCGGSDAQAVNVMGLALSDIRTLGAKLAQAERERDELRAALEGIVSVYRDKDTDAAMETEIVLAEAALIATKKEG